MGKWQWVWEGALGVVTVLGLAMVLFTAPGGHLLNILASSAPLGLVAVALSLSMRAGTPNLAVGSVAALSGVLIASVVVVLGMPLVVGVLLVILLAALSGLVMGAFTVLLEAPAWAVTLAAAVVCDALSLAFTQARTILLPEAPSLSPVVGFAVFAVVSVAGGLLWARREFRQWLAKGWVGPLVGLAGSCVLAALGGFVLLLRLGAAQPGSQGLFTMVFALAAVLLGGTGLPSLSSLPSPLNGAGAASTVADGGRGGVAGTLLAVLILAIVQGELTLLAVPTYVIMIVLGGVVIAGLAVSRALDALRQ
ncbi:ABC transporter permease subunit [Nonomuraea sp. NPDC003201]